MTLELAHPSTEPVPSQAPVDPSTHPRWWFWITTPGRILVSGVVLITAYKKGRTENISAAERNEIRKLVAGIEAELRARRPKP